MPSGHTTEIYGATLPLAIFRRRGLTFFLSAYACAMGLSRVYLGGHFTSDVAAGALLGTLGFIAILLIWRRMGGPAPRTLS